MFQQDINSSNRETDAEQNEIASVTQEGGKKTYYFLPLLLLLGVILVDQVSKYLIVSRLDEYLVRNGPLNFFNGFIHIVKVYNKGIAFSLFSEGAFIFRLLLVYVVPVIFIAYLFMIIMYSNFDTVSRWYAACVAGGGCGNLIDRIFRAEGVVDFISVNMYNVFNLTRWPTFNVADMAVVVGMLLWVSTTLFSYRKRTNGAHQEQRVESNKAKVDEIDR